MDIESLGQILLNQDNRFLRVESCLGDDTLFLKSIRGTEGLSRPFELDVELLSNEPNINPLDIIGDHIATFIDASSGAPKALNGFVAEFEYTGLEYRGIFGYRARLVPWFWFLKKRIDCRVFQQLSVPEIFEKICSEFGYQDFQLSFTEEHPALEYCVQYSESNYDFLSRLLENEGIFYFFEQQDDKHIMHLADNISAFAFLEDDKDITHSSGTRKENTIRAWRHQYRYLSGNLSQNDFDYEKYTHSLVTETSSNLNIKNASNFKIYDYPGLYKESDRGNKLTQLRMEELESGFNIITATSDVKNLAVGKMFTLCSDETQADDQKNFIVSEIYHEATDLSFQQDNQENGGVYTNNIRCLPEGATYRPALVTPCPRIDGVETAVVVGKSGDEIYTDEYGRIKVQFHWDLYGQKDENSSCWVRVATQWAGKKWGTIGIPRVGQEVVVTFVNGDPDRPLVIGSVYNSAHMPPFDLPADKNVRGVKSRSTKGGDRGTFNEISLDDSKGAEKFKINAQKDFNMNVGNNAGANTVGNSTANVDGNVTSTVGGDKSTTISGGDTLSVGADLSGSVGGKKSYTVGSDQSEEVGGNDSANVCGNQDLTVAGNQDCSVSGNQASNIGGNQEASVGGNQTISVGGAHDLSALSQAISISTSASTDATEISLNGNVKISLAVAGSSITIDPSGITISMGASSVQVNPAGVTVSGPIVKLN